MVQIEKMWTGNKNIADNLRAWNHNQEKLNSEIRNLLFLHNLGLEFDLDLITAAESDTEIRQSWD